MEELVGQIQYEPVESEVSEKLEEQLVQFKLDVQVSQKSEQL